MGLTADLAAALAVIPDRELHLLRTTIDREPIVVPALSAWLEAAIAWEIDRRAGARPGFPDPGAAMDGAEAECSLVALAILCTRLRGAERAAEFLDLTAAALCDDVRGSPRDVH
jgi:hypothetical protein